MIRKLYILILLLCAACSSLSFEGSFKKAEGEIGLGNYAKAAKLYEKLANKFAGDDRVAVIWLRLGDLYAYPMDRAVDGLGAYQKAIESSPTSEAARLAHERRAEVFEKIGRPSGMIEEYTALLKYFPDSADAPRYKMRLGESYLMAEEYQQARTELRGFVEKAGVEASQRQRALFDIGETYFLEGKPGKAVRFYYTLLRENPKSPLAAEAELRIATCLEEMGYLGTAYKFVYDAKNRYPNEKVIDERLEGLKNRGKGYEKSKSVKNPASGKTAEGVEEKPPIE